MIEFMNVVSTDFNRRQEIGVIVLYLVQVLEIRARYPNRHAQQ